MAINSGRAFTLFEIIIVIAIIAILFAIACPGNGHRPRPQVRARACQENLSRIKEAKAQLTKDKNRALGDPVEAEALVRKESADPAYLKSFPNEPSGYSYIIGPIGEEPRCTSRLPDHWPHEIPIVITETDDR